MGAGLVMLSPAATPTYDGFRFPEDSPAGRYERLVKVVNHYGINRKRGVKLHLRIPKEKAS